MGCHSLLQRIFPTQGSNLGLAHCRQILYHLNHQGSPQSMLVLSFRFAEYIKKITAYTPKKGQFLQRTWLHQRQTLAQVVSSELVVLVIPDMAAVVGAEEEKAELWC